MASEQIIKQAAHSPAKATAQQVAGGKSLPAVPVLQQRSIMQAGIATQGLAETDSKLARFPARPAQRKAGAGANTSAYGPFPVQMKEIFPGSADSVTRYIPQKKSGNSNLATGAIQTGNGGTVQRVIRNNGDGSVIGDYDLDALDYYSAEFIRGQVEDLRVWSADPADMEKVNAAVALGPVVFGGGGGGAASGGKGGGKPEIKAPGKVAKEKKGAVPAERVTTFPHKGKHCPPPGAVGKAAALQAATAGKGNAALYNTNDPGTVVGWEATARASGLLLADGFTVVHKFSFNIGADQGELTNCIRIDGDHGHPISESTGKQSFDAYVIKDVQAAKKALDAARILVIVTWLKANSLSTADYVKGVPQKLLPPA